MKKNDKGSQSDSNASEIAEKTTNKRRKFLAGITTGAAAGMVSNGNWVKPVVDSVVLPVHAQTSGSDVMQIQSVTTDGDEFDAYQGILHTDGTHAITIDDAGSFSNFQANWSALFQPVQNQTVSVNLDVTIDVAGPGTTNAPSNPLSQTSSANVPVDGAMRANFLSTDFGLSGGSDANTVTTVRGTVQAEGFGTKRVTYVISS